VPATNLPSSFDVLPNNFNVLSLKSIRNLVDEVEKYFFFFSAEIVVVFIGASLGLLANILLIFGVSWSKR
jgi:hypothetical protein